MSGDTGRYAAREADWRCGALVYQVLVDRFAPPADAAAKAALYAPPRRLRAWHDRPSAGRFLPDEQVWSHELDFWGGDLAGVRQKLDHLDALGVDVLYLNPIHPAFTNHKYDALDYAGVSPEYGSAEDLAALAEALHARGRRLMLDGVFNHVGRRSARFADAQANAQSEWRDWFSFDATLPGGARSWWRAPNLPELNLEHAPAFAHVLDIVRGALEGPPGRPQAGIDGWRLDVAYDLGPALLARLRAAAHAARPGSWVLGEIPNWPTGWVQSGAVDGTLLFGVRRLLIELCAGRLAPARFTRQFGRLADELGIDALLRCWLYLDNHDTPRLAHALPDERARRLARLLQYTLPGAPNVYYGAEVDDEGGDDPAMRAPMRWDRVAQGHPMLALLQQLGALRRGLRALRIGELRWADSERLVAFERVTDRAADTVLVLANPGPEPVSETVVVPDPWLMDGVPWVVHVALGEGGSAAPAHAGFVDVRLPPFGALLLQPVTAPQGGYTPYKRIP